MLCWPSGAYCSDSVVLAILQFIHEYTTLLPLYRITPSRYCLQHWMVVCQDGSSVWMPFYHWWPLYLFTPSTGACKSQHSRFSSFGFLCDIEISLAIIEKQNLLCSSFLSSLGQLQMKIEANFVSVCLEYVTVRTATPLERLMLAPWMGGNKLHCFSRGFASAALQSLYCTRA